MKISATVLFLGLAVAAPGTAGAQTEAYTVIFGGQRIGHLVARTDDRQTNVEFDYKNNGRGPTIKEVITTDAEGIPTTWTVTGSTSFGGRVDEQFTRHATAGTSVTGFVTERALRTRCAGSGDTRTPSAAARR